MQDTSGAADAPQSIAELQARLAAIVASSDDAIISKDLNGIVKTWNTGAERMFGYTAAEMIGQSILKLLPPERQDEEAEILAQIRRGQRVDHFKTVRMRKDGTRIAVSATISPVRDASGNVVGASKVARDMTRSLEIQGMFEAIVASSDDAIVSKDLNGIVKSWNAGAERIFGYTAAEIVGKSISILFPPDRLDEEPQILNRLKRGERVDHFETIRVRKDGQLINVSVTISPIKGVTGEVIGASKIARDITVLKRYMAEREHLLESEQAARREIERVSRAKDEFLATLSHELRTPLNAIVGWASLLRASTPSEADLIEGLETIERNARAQARLVDELLDMSRIISGKMRLDVQRVDLAAVVDEAVETIRLAADAKQIRIFKLLDPAAGPVTGDPNRLRQVVWNLLNNAIKFTPRGGRVQVLLQRINSHIEITISDTGRGIEPQFVPQLFAKFTQADASTTRQHGGLGLGLAIVRHLVELHGGTVRASSAGVDQGATFVVTLPLSVVFDQRPESESSHPASQSVAAHPLPPLAIDLTGVKVLIVDDEPDARQLIKRVLEAHGATVVTADSAPQGIEMLRRELPSVLLSDIGMPDEDGYALLERVRALPAAEGGVVPAAALTAFARSEDRQRALLAGFHLHVPKPVEPAELLAVVANLAGVTRRPAAASGTATNPSR